MATYDPQKCSFSWNGVTAMDWAPGTMFEVEPNADAVTLVVGTDGLGATVKNADRSGKFTVTLKQTSPTNALWSAAIVPTYAPGAAILKAPAMLKDAGSDTTLAHAELAWNVKLPKVGRGKDMQETVWVFETDRLDMTIGGSVLV